MNYKLYKVKENSNLIDYIIYENGKIIEELSKKGIDLELVTRLMGDFLSDRKDVFISKEEETEYMACEKYYKEKLKNL